MKKIITSIVFSVFLYTANACEICGCGLGNYYIGILPHFKNKFIGLRYQYHSFRTKMNDDPSQFSKDFYQTTEIWAGWSITKKLQILAFVPYNFNHQVSDEGTSNLKGFGDIALLLNYKVLDINSKNSTGKKVSQELWIGGGVKLPTGRFEIEAGNPDIASMANMQRGSGSSDVMLNTMYNIRVAKWGINTNASYKINSANKDDYKFGNKFSASSFVYYAAQAFKTVISPNIGLQYEHNQASQLINSKINLTGGSILQVAAGVEFGFNKMAIGFNTQLPATQNFADGQTKSKIKGMVHVTFAF
ncbi:MAG: transporter [Chitinophagaceae bacterium]|nr:transporter [Chitinophagaceae bacterium]MBK9568635.1 transporter [Chitinophagaceae bacterium]MBL0272763.1 transporter [Chitinophagaceae bacterium]